jgi:hypothetical protein
VAPLFMLAWPHGSVSVGDCSLFLLALSGAVSDQGGESVACMSLGARDVVFVVPSDPSV